jgi:hypothetical protein
MSKHWSEMSAEERDARAFAASLDDADNLTRQGPRLTSASYDDAPTRAERKQASAAASFVESAEMEALAKLRDSNPDRYDRVDPMQKASLGYYLNAKKAAG